MCGDVYDVRTGMRKRELQCLHQSPSYLLLLSRNLCSEYAIDGPYVQRRLRQFGHSLKF